MRSAHSFVYLLTLISLALFLGCAATQDVAVTVDEPVMVDVDRAALAVAADTLLTSPLEASGATVSVIVGDARTGTVLFEHDADRYMLPASVQKLFVAADAMLKQPEGFRFETTIFSNGPLVDGTVHGDLVIAGGWDPSLSGDEPYVEWPWAVFDSLANALKDRGVNQIEGDLIVEGAAYLPAGWEVGDLEYRFAPRISQLMWNDGLVSNAQKVTGVHSMGLKVTVWPNSVFWSIEHTELWPHQTAKISEPKKPVPPPVMTIQETPVQPLGGWDIYYIPSPRPRVLAGDAFREALRRAGIQGGDSTRALAPLPMQMPKAVEDGVRLVHKSAPLDSLLAPMLKVSSNAWAEQIAAGTGSYKYGMYQLTWPSVLESLGIGTADDVVAADACGMSRRNRMRAESLHNLLVAANGRWSDRWLNLLPHAKEEGSTLKNRLDGLESRVIAKTGTLSGSRSLAGYILDEDGEPALDFVVIVNHAPNSPTAAMDDYVRALVTALEEEE
jgi:serine-type D-Ala-D-Ala carboxypeptidase/endopeptidase (penicillin-binding protein 4)